MRGPIKLGFRSSMFWPAGGSMFSLVLLAQGCPFLPTDTEFPVAEVVVVAEPASLGLGGLAQARATLRDSYGAELTDIEVSWSSSQPSVATVTPNGEVTTAVVRGVGAGIATITATAGGHSGAAAVQVTSTDPPPAPVSSVVVALSSSNLSASATTQATATLRDANGNELTGRAVSWSSSNQSVATVSSSGGTSAVVTAVTAGSAQITAISEGRSGSATVTVTTGGTPSTGYPNQPSGFSVITERPFSLPLEDGWGMQIYNGITNGIGIAADLTGPKSAPGVVQVYYPAGFASGGQTGAAWKMIESYGYSRLYVSFWVKLSSDWYGHPVAGKVGYIHTHGKPVVVPVYVGEGSSRLSSQIRIQDVPSGAANFDPNLANPEIRRGEWVRWEILLVNNTGDNANGEMHWWINGTKAGEYRSLKFSTSGQSKVWDTLALDPIWGGCCATVPYDMYMWVDHYYASGMR